MYPLLETQVAQQKIFVRLNFAGKVCPVFLLFHFLGRISQFLAAPPRGAWGVGALGVQGIPSSVWHFYVLPPVLPGGELVGAQHLPDFLSPSAPQRVPCALRRFV